VPKHVRFSLLATWLEAIYEDFAWRMDSARQFLPVHCLNNRLFSLIGLAVFLARGRWPQYTESIQVWWRRTSIRQYVAEQDNSHLQILVCDHPNWKISLQGQMKSKPQYVTASFLQVYINNLSFSPSIRLEVKPWKWTCSSYVASCDWRSSREICMRYLWC
jgi:hypothetical protein